MFVEYRKKVEKFVKLETAESNLIECTQHSHL